jgi:hypothetical protein
MIVLKNPTGNPPSGSGYSYCMYGKKPPIPMRFNVSKYFSLSSARQLENNINALPALIRRMGRAQSTVMAVAATRMMKEVFPNWSAGACFPLPRLRGRVPRQGRESNRVKWKKDSSKPFSFS